MGIIKKKKKSRKRDESSGSEACLMQDRVNPEHSECSREIVRPQIQKVPEALWKGWDLSSTVPVCEVC